MNLQLKKRLDETIAELTPQYQSQLLDFGEYLRAKQLASEPSAVGIEETLTLLRSIVKSTPAGRLGPPYLDLTDFKFDREEANER